MKVRVVTTLAQDLEVPDGASKEEVLDFLSEYQSFRSAFQGVDDLDGVFRIEDLVVIDETVELDVKENEDE
jgi:hypothetical protein